MNPGLVVKFHPAGPWRSGPDSGSRNRVDPIYHSDSLYAAVTAAMATLGRRDEWLDATARNAEGPAVRFSSCFPFLGDLGFVVPPRSLWPPMGGAAVTASKVRWRSARFVPLPLIGALLEGHTPAEHQWVVDGASECLLPAGRPGPFRTSLRWGAALDRLTGSGERHATACIEFRREAGLWAIASFADEERRAHWSDVLRGALRLLGDSGFGGERSRGWGRCAEVEFVEGTLPDMILPAPATPSPAEAVESEPPAAPAEPAATSHWLLSLFTPGAADTVDWTRGNYTVISRGGHVDSPFGSGERKKQVQMVSEGSVLVGSETIHGSAPDVAPDGFPHPVFRAGFAVSVPLPTQEIA